MPVFTGQTVKYAIKYLLGTTTRRDIDTGTQQIADSVEAALSALLPPGTVVNTVRATAPAGWRLCDGTLITRTGADIELYDLLGTTFNTGGETGSQRRLPDLRGRVVIGPDGSAGRITNNDALGNTGGLQTHTLAVSEIAGHGHILRQQTGIGGGITVGGSGTGRVATGGADPIAGGTGTDLVTESAGGGQAHNNLQPYQVLNVIVKL